MCETKSESTQGCGPKVHSFAWPIHVLYHNFFLGTGNSRKKFSKTSNFKIFHILTEIQPFEEHI